MKRLILGLYLISALGAGSLAPNGVQTVPGALVMHATIESVGVVSPYEGDDNQNNDATIWYRPVGESVWLAGPEMFADRHAREWRVSLVYLSPGTEYEIEVQYTDSDGVTPTTVNGSIHMRPDYPGVGSGGNIFYVPDDGGLQAVIDAASPGDTVRIRAGTYHTTAELGVKDSGTPGNYLTIEADPGAYVVLDGSDIELNDPGVNNWHYYQNNIYYIDLPWGSSECDSLPSYVGEQREGDGVRYLLYRGSSQWDDFMAGPAGKAHYNCAGRLHVVTYDADDPDNHEMHVSRRRLGFILEGADYVRIRNIEFRYYSSYGVYLAGPGADHNVIEGNTFHGIGWYHVRVGPWSTPLGSDNLIQDNHFYERGYRDSGWTWDSQYHYAYSVGVRLNYAGPGNVIRHNTFTGGCDAIDVGWQSHDTDVSENIIEEYMDDGIEVDDQPGQNIRVWGNTIRHCFSSISNQDWFMGDYWNSGPIYIFRNVIEGGSDPQGRTDANGDIYFSNYAFKVGTDEDWIGRVYYYHNTIYIPDSPVGGNGVQTAGGDHFSGIVGRNNLWNVRGRVFNMFYPNTITHHDLDCDNLHNAGTPTDSRFIQWSHSGGPEGNGVYCNLFDFQAYTGQELHGISDNGTLFNPDLSLQEGSPEIDAGCVITGFNDRGPWAYQGQRPDIGAFEYQEYPGIPDLSTSTKEASSKTVSSGDSITYTVRIVNTGSPFTSLVVVTDTLPVGLDYLDGTVTATLGTAWVSQGSAIVPSIHWQGIMSDTPTVEIRYGVSINVSGTLALPNTAWIDDGLTRVISRSTTIIVNGWSLYLPVILRDW